MSPSIASAAVICVLSAVSGLAIVLLSPLLVDIVNVFRPKDKHLISSEEIYDAYDYFLCKIFVCEACQSVWATLIAVVVLTPGCWLRMFFICYAPVLVLWLLVKTAYEKLR
jgi:hypothetical protein